MPLCRVHSQELGLAAGSSFEILGELPPSPRLAIVGSRAVHRPTLCAVQAAVRACQKMGWSVVSGGALGTDGEVHRSALKLGVAQLAILPCGSDRRYPERHRGLFSSMEAEEKAAIVFSLPKKVRGGRGVFASRNRLVVGAASAVLVAQARLPSGSYGTGRLALSQGVHVAVFPGSEGAAALAAQGALVLPKDAAQEGVCQWLESMMNGSTIDSWQEPWPSSLAWLHTAIKDAGASGFTIEMLSDPIQGICALSEAESLRLVIRVGGGRWFLYA